MHYRRLLASVACAMLLTACSGGGSSSPTATPTPAPTPTPTPIPTPTPTPTAITYTVEAGSPTIAQITFRDGPLDAVPTNANTYINFTNRLGTFTAGQRDGVGPGGAGGLIFDGTQPLYNITAGGFDRDSSEYVGTGAPAGATVISVINELYKRVGSQIRVKRALRLDAGPRGFLLIGIC